MHCDVSFCNPLESVIYLGCLSNWSPCWRVMFPNCEARIQIYPPPLPCGTVFLHQFKGTAMVCSSTNPSEPARMVVWDGLVPSLPFEQGQVEKGLITSCINFLQTGRISLLSVALNIITCFSWGVLRNISCTSRRMSANNWTESSRLHCQNFHQFQITT